jgi:hypothetical protein
MAWVKFTGRFHHRPAGLVSTIVYLEGMRCNVTSDAQAEALALGVAEPIPAPSRASADKLKADPLWVEAPHVARRRW